MNDENMDKEGRLVLSLGQRNIIDVDVTAAGPGELFTFSIEKSGDR